MGTPIKALGVTITRAGETIPNVLSLGGPSLNADLADVTPLDATNDFEEQLPTIIRTGDVTLEMSYIPASLQKDMRTDITSKTLREYVVQIPTSSGTTESHTFNAYVTGFEPNFDPGSQVKCTATLKPTGSVTVTES